MSLNVHTLPHPPHTATHMQQQPSPQQNMHPTHQPAAAVPRPAPPSAQAQYSAQQLQDLRRHAAVDVTSLVCPHLSPEQQQIWKQMNQVCFVYLHIHPFDFLYTHPTSPIHTIAIPPSSTHPTYPLHIPPNTHKNTHRVPPRCPRSSSGRFSSSWSHGSLTLCGSNYVIHWYVMCGHDGRRIPCACSCPIHAHCTPLKFTHTYSHPYIHTLLYSHTHTHTPIYPPPTHLYTHTLITHSVPKSNCSTISNKHGHQEMG